MIKYFVTKFRQRVLAILFVTVFFWASNDVAVAEEYPIESPQQHDARMQWWREARFGMFIHWGVYSELGGEYQGCRTNQNGDDCIGEWIKAWADIPSEEYDKLLKGFYPVHYDPESWVRLAKEAGMQYLIITTKHHDGFCLYDSRVTKYDVVDGTPYGKDLLTPLAEACKKHGVRLCFYYSILDWHHPAQEANPNAGHDTNHGLNQTIMLPGRKTEYVKYMKAQLEELITIYDPAVIWFDGEWADWWTEEDGQDLYNYLRGLKPSLIINNRVGKGRKGMEGFSKDSHYAGDFGTPEQQIPDTGVPGVDWESCMTMNDTWGYKFYDHNWKPTETLLRNLVDTTSKGGNYLLNVGPTPDGRIPEASIQRLQEIGRWMKTNGESIYATSASPFGKLPWGRCTKKQGKLFLHVFDWPSSKLELPKIDGKVRRAYFLADPSHSLSCEITDHSIVISLPEKSPNAIDSVIVLELDDSQQD